MSKNLKLNKICIFIAIDTIRGYFFLNNLKFNNNYFDYVY